MFMESVEQQGIERIEKLHAFSKKLWGAYSVESLRSKCQESWDELGVEPLIPIIDGEIATNLIFGSGSFSTGRFQANQYNKDSSIKLQGIVTNKSSSNGSGVASEFNLPLIELDFIDWYHNNYDKKEDNPIRATSFWGKDLPKQEIVSRFSIRQKFHQELGDLIAETTGIPTSTVSLRGYSFPVSSNLFKDCRPHYNDTHPADMTYVNDQGVKLYPGWQSGAVQLMIDDGHKSFRGSLIGVKCMDSVEQVNELDEGELFAIGRGVRPENAMKADEVQSALKLIDDYFFCTLEPTGLYLLWGVTKEPVKVIYQDVQGNPVAVIQRGVYVGDKACSGVSAFGFDLESDLNKLKEFLF